MNDWKNIYSCELIYQNEHGKYRVIKSELFPDLDSAANEGRMWLTSGADEARPGVLILRTSLLWDRAWES